MEYGLLTLWLVAYLALLYVGMPIARALMPSLADRGAGLALPAALAVLWLVAYLVGHLSITLGLYLGLVVLGALALGLWYTGYETDNRAYTEVAVVFTAAFLFMIAIRVFDPSAHPGGGEKFLDMGLLQSLMRSATIPPEDAWFAGETVRYYYGGHYLSSLLARLTGTEARYAYNLALAGFFGMLVTGVYSVAGSIAASRGFSYRRAGLFGAFFVGIASNLLTAARIGLGLLPDGAAESIAGALGVEIDGAAQSLSAFGYWAASRIIPATINEFPFFAWLNGDLHAHMMNTVVLVLVVGVLAGLSIGASEYSRRRQLGLLFGVVPALAGMVAVFSTWAFPTVGGLVALTLILGRVSPIGLVAPTLSDRLERRHRGLYEVARVVVGVVAAAVTLVLGIVWSLPYWLYARGATEGIGFVQTQSGLGGLLVVHGAFLVLFWVYYYRHAKPIAADSGTGVALVAAAVIGSLLAAVAGLVVPVVPAVPAVALFGPLILLGWVFYRLVDDDGGVTGGSTVQTSPTSASDGGVARTIPGFETVLIVGVAGLVILVELVHVVDTIAPPRFNTVFKVYMQVWVLAAIAAGVVCVRLRDEYSPGLGLSSPRARHGLRVLSVAVVVATSLYTALALTDHLDLGTHLDLLSLVGLGPEPPGWMPGLLAKVFYPPGWLVMGVIVFGSVVLGAMALDRVETAVRSGRLPTVESVTGAQLVVALLVVSAGFLGAVSLTTVLAGPDGGRLGEPTLDSLAYVEKEHPNEAEAIQWLLDLEGQPNMVSDPNNGDSRGEGYTWGNAPASLTGVPTLAGWWPERGYRGHDVYAQRVDHVERIFTGNPEAQRYLLKYYNVELIYLGPNEREQYNGITVTELDAVSVAQSWDDVTIYRVDQSALPPIEN